MINSFEILIKRINIIANRIIEIGAVRVENGKIKEHFKKVNELGKPIIARTPVIPEISQGIEEISEFMKQLKHVKQYELLPYHPLGGAKREALGLKADGFTIPSKEYMKELENYVFVRK